MNPPPGIEPLPNGQWVISHDTHLGLWARQHGTIVTDPHLFKWLKPHLEGVDVVWDIGACIGDHTRQYLDWNMSVVAVEPNPLAFACLKHNCPEAVCLNIAASDSAKVVPFLRLDNVGASRITPDVTVETTGGFLDVAADRMDSIAFREDLLAPELIKIDVEGHEVFALQGMQQAITTFMPILFVEINRSALAANNHTPNDVMNLIRSYGYSDFTLYPPQATWDDPQFDVLCEP